MICSGIGLLRMKPRGRTCAIAWAFFDILRTLFSTAYALGFTIRNLKRTIATLQTAGNFPSDDNDDLMMTR